MFSRRMSISTIAKPAMMTGFCLGAMASLSVYRLITGFLGKGESIVPTTRKRRIADFSGTWNQIVQGDGKVLTVNKDGSAMLANQQETVSAEIVQLDDGTVSLITENGDVRTLELDSAKKCLFSIVGDDIIVYRKAVLQEN